MQSVRNCVCDGALSPVLHTGSDRRRKGWLRWVFSVLTLFLYIYMGGMTKSGFNGEGGNKLLLAAFISQASFGLHRSATPFLAAGYCLVWEIARERSGRNG